MGDELNPAVKDRIDRMTYKEMLTLWRFSPAGNPLFVGATGKYFSDVMGRKSLEVDHVAISKEIGW